MSTPVPDVSTPPKKRKNAWILVSVGLGVVVVGLLVWALMSRADANDAKDELASTEQALKEAAATPAPTATPTATATATPTATAASDDNGRRGLAAAGAFAAAQAIYDDLAAQLGAT